MAEIGEKIKEARKWKGLTQQQLAQASDMSLMSIRRYEAGERLPTEQAVVSIAKALGVNPADLDERLVVSLGSDVMITAEDGTTITVAAETREGKILTRLQAMNNAGKDELIRTADNLLEADKFRRRPKEQ